MAGVGQKHGSPIGSISRHKTSTNGSESKRFELLIGDLSAALVRATGDGIARELEHWHKQIVAVLGLDRSSIARIDEHSRTFYLAYQWARPGTPKFPRGFNLGVHAPCLTRKLIEGESIIYSNPDELPPEFALDLKQTGEFAPKSLVAIPMVVGGVTVGMVGFGTSSRFRTWPPQVLRRLHLVAELYSNALARQRIADANATLRAELTHVSRAATMGELAASLATNSISRWLRFSKTPRPFKLYLPSQSRTSTK